MVQLHRGDDGAMTVNLKMAGVVIGLVMAIATPVATAAVMLYRIDRLESTIAVQVLPKVEKFDRFVTAYEARDAALKERMATK